MKTFGWFGGVVLVAVMLMVALAPTPAHAGFVSSVETFTIPLGETGSTSTLTVTMNRAKITDMYLWCPTLDASDTATLSLTITPFYTNADSTIAAATVAPNGWTSKVIGATADNAIVKVLSAVTALYVDGPININVTCSTEQAAARVFYVLIIREY